MLKWFEGLSQKSSSNFGLPDEWEFDYPFSQVKTGFWLWMMSGFQRLPAQDEIDKYDSRWIDDMMVAHDFYGFYTNSDGKRKIFDELMARQGGNSSHLPQPKSKINE